MSIFAQSQYDLIFAPTSSRAPVPERLASGLAAPEITGARHGITVWLLKLTRAHDHVISPLNERVYGVKSAPKFLNFIQTKNFKRKNLCELPAKRYEGPAKRMQVFKMLFKHKTLFECKAIRRCSKFDSSTKLLASKKIYANVQNFIQAQMC